LLGVSQAQLSKYERGKSAPPLEMLLRLKRHFGKGLDWIVTGEIEQETEIPSKKPRH
jgi:transcriptional regulator with XRE-family HTH domain